ncbi:hypothetical protein BJ166DRAFT_166123 [Pestalotiopsis sp. NC0098]|nr:hypothetical protein BJ166DRAFT_166123 [Pestalotiopsis sp. NC0098]
MGQARTVVGCFFQWSAVWSLFFLGVERVGRQSFFVLFPAVGSMGGCFGFFLYCVRRKSLTGEEKVTVSSAYTSCNVIKRGKGETTVCKHIRFGVPRHYTDDEKARLRPPPDRWKQNTEGEGTDRQDVQEEY